MKLHNLTPAAGSKGREKRIGRGEGSGHGGTSTRGHKGLRLVLVTLARSVSREVRCLSREDFLSLVSPILLV